MCWSLLLYVPLQPWVWQVSQGATVVTMNVQVQEKKRVSFTSDACKCIRMLPQVATSQVQEQTACVAETVMHAHSLHDVVNTPSAVSS